MRRLAAIALALLALVGAGFAIAGSSAQGSSSYGVDVIFDNARGLLPNQLVKIAGARVGTIKTITLTPDYKARVEMLIDGRFAPFRANASCSIRPEGLIAENYVNCDPGTASAPPLRPSGGHDPTVPVTHTTEPVSLTDLFNVFTAPVRDRFTLLVNELGIGFAARGGDINAILRRANPTLALARRAIGILNGQRAQIATFLDSSDRIIAQLARRTGSVQDFIVRAAHVGTQTASHRGALAEGVRRLPRLLLTARPALAALDELTVSGTPLLAELRASAPSLNTLSSDIGPFAQAARPAIARFGATLVQGTAVVRRAPPVIRTLLAYTRASLPAAVFADKLFVNLRERGASESLLGLFYHLSAATARYDSTSHILPAHISLNSCSNFAQAPTAGCSADYSSAGAAAAGVRAGSRHSAGAGRGARPSGAAPQTLSPELARRLRQLGFVSSDQRSQPLQSLIAYLLK